MSSPDSVLVREGELSAPDIQKQEEVGKNIPAEEHFDIRWREDEFHHEKGVEDPKRRCQVSNGWKAQTCLVEVY